MRNISIMDYKHAVGLLLNGTEHNAYLDIIATTGIKSVIVTFYHHHHHHFYFRQEGL